jgi:hypothetical protein
VCVQNKYFLGLLFVFGALWALPMTLVGLIAGLPFLLFGAKFKLCDHALVFHHFPIGPGGAMTLGNVILHTGASMDEQAKTYACSAGGPYECVRIGSHERAHVYQYMAFGIFFLPLYFAFGGISVKNPFERAADRYALTGKDWWPWA